MTILAETQSPVIPSTSSENQGNERTPAHTKNMMPTSIPSTSSRWGPKSQGTLKAVSVSSAALAAHCKLFNYSGGKVSKGKRAKKERKPTCSLKVLCMSSCSRDRPPVSVKEQTNLANAGLGDAVIVFNLDGDSAHLHEKLLEKFPKLGTAGYQLLLFHRNGEESAFCALKPPYTPRRLKELVGQCKVYIQPLQQDFIEDETCNMSPEVLNVKDVS